MTNFRDYSKNAGTQALKKHTITPPYYWQPTYDQAPDKELLEEYLEQEGAVDLDRPLCFNAPNGKPCVRVAVPGSEFCEECDG